MNSDWISLRSIHADYAHVVAWSKKDEYENRFYNANNIV